MVEQLTPQQLRAVLAGDPMEVRAFLADYVKWLANAPIEHKHKTAVMRRLFEIFKTSPYGKRLIKATKRRQNHKCAYCNQELTRGYHVEHIFPISEGGSPTASSNLCVACPPCNYKKARSTDKEYWKELYRKRVEAARREKALEYGGARAELLLPPPQPE